MRYCAHTELDPQGAVGPGFVRCLSCGKSIPVERFLVQLNEEIKTLRIEVQQLKEASKQWSTPRKS